MAHDETALHGEDQAKSAHLRALAALAGFEGDEAAALGFFGDEDGEVRAVALGALVRMGRATAGITAAALADPAPVVRRRAAELATGLVEPDVRRLLGDGEASVVEAACFAAGELGDPSLVPELCATAAGHEDALCRESAVAALGAIGDPGGLPAILAALGDRPAVRRRAVIALAPFEGPDVDAGLQKALADRDWQVRQAAEDQLR